MKNIKYEIEFFTDWHCGSGLAAGAGLDATVIKDKNKLPFIPGKTIKGLLREAVEIICKNKEVIHKAFGNFDNQTKHIKGEMFFTNAELCGNEKKQILSQELVAHLYRSVTSTAIEENGIAKDHSLRKIEVTVPCFLYGEILNVPHEIYADILKALKFIKRLGVNRNRGLGSCCFSVINNGEVKS